jgi:hypothetical protein
MQVSDGPFSHQQAVQEINEEHFSFRFPKDSLETPIGERRDSLFHKYIYVYLLQNYALILNGKIFFSPFSTCSGKLDKCSVLDVAMAYEILVL